MSDTKIHSVFWLLVVLGLLWNVAGAMNYLMQMNPDLLAAMPDTHRAIIEGRPVWATGGFAIGVFGGALGCLLLLLRKSIAILVFMISLVGIFVTTIHSLQVVIANENFSAGEISMMVISPIIVANLLIGLTFYAIKKEWLS